VNLPQNGSPEKSDLKNEILLLKQHMVQLNMELFQAQMTAAQNSCNESQFKQRAAEVTARFEATRAEAQDMWNQAHEGSMGQQKGASNAQITQLKNEANQHIAKLTEKLDETQRKARKFQANLKTEADRQLQANSFRLESEMQKREAELQAAAQAHFDQRKSFHTQEVQAKNLEIQ